MIRIALCDDDKSVAESVEACIASSGFTGCTFDVFYDGQKLLDYLHTNDERYNIYLMDIEMPLVGGIEAATAIRRADSDALILFITDHQEFVYDVFETLPFRFLRKPVKQEDLQKALAAAIDHIGLSGQLFFYRVGHEKRQVPCRDILYFESVGRKVIIHGASTQEELYGKISSIAEGVDRNLFAQIHVSFLVNLDYIRAIRQGEVALANGTVLPVSKKFQKHIREQHLLFMERRCAK